MTGFRLPAFRLPIALVIMLASSTVFAQGAPATVSFAARLQDNGLPLMGAHDFVFALYDQPTAGTQKFSQTFNQQMIGDGGLLYLDLGPFSATTHFTGPALYLEITIDGQVTTPRILVESVPYALRSGKAGDADGMGGLPPTSWQKAVNNTCVGATDSIKSINQDGSVTCYTGAVYTAAVGGGLLLTSNAFSVDPTVYQKRIVGCASGAIASVGPDGTATCITAGSGISIASNVISADNTIQRARSAGCTNGFLSSFTQTGTPTCVTAGSGLNINTGTLTVDTTAIQKILTGSTCAAGQVVQKIDATTGAVTCVSLPALPQTNLVTTAELRNNNSYGNLTTNGPTVTITIGSSASAMVTVTASITPVDTGSSGQMGFTATCGATTINPADTQALSFGASTAAMQASATFLVTGLVAGSCTFTAKYKGPGNGATFANRTLTVVPL